jgi:hypothetical protein
MPRRGALDIAFCCCLSLCCFFERSACGWIVEYLKNIQRQYTKIFYRVSMISWDVCSRLPVRCFYERSAYGWIVELKVTVCEARKSNIESNIGRISKNIKRQRGKSNCILFFEYCLSAFDILQIFVYASKRRVDIAFCCCLSLCCFFERSACGWIVEYLKNIQRQYTKIFYRVWWYLEKCVLVSVCFYER